MEVGGSARMLCTLTRENLCILRTIDAQGHERVRTQGVPGTCSRYVERPDGGGYLLTRGGDNQVLTITTLDRAGTPGASLALTSKHWVYDTDVITSGSGDLLLSLVFRDDLTFGARRLAFARYFQAAVLRMPAALDRVDWYHVFTATESGVTALVPSTTPDAVDAIVSFRGTLRSAGPAPLTGSGRHGWGGARVTLDADGKAIEQADLSIEPGFAISHAASLGDGRLAVITPDPTTPAVHNLTVVDAAGARSPKARQGAMLTSFLHTAGDRTWTLTGNPAGEPKLLAPWTARAIDGGALAVFGFAELPVYYASIASRGDRYALLGQTEDPATRTPVTFVALGSIAASGGRIDLGTLTIANHLVLAAGCRGPERKLAAVVDDVRRRHADAFVRCGAKPGSRIDITVHPDGGISTYDFRQPIRPIKAGTLTTYEASPSVGRCVRAILDPELACPVRGVNLSFAALFVPAAS